MELSELKRSRDYLLSVLGIQKAGHSMRCPFHTDKSPSFSVWQGPRDHVWLWKCNSGCGMGTIIDAAMKVYSVRFADEAYRALEKELGIKIGRDEELVEPIINDNIAEQFVNDAHANLINSPELQDVWMRKKRGIFDLDTIRRFRVGFVTPDKFAIRQKPWWRMFGWIMPVTDASGMMVAVKLHTERALWQIPNKKSPKCVWLPFGTYPPKDPKHGTATLWPNPELFAGVENLYLCAGELKALAMISAGFAAIAPTGGESALKESLVNRIVKAAPKKVFIVADKDEAKMINGKLIRHGDVWRDAVLKQLRAADLSCHSFFTGQKIEESKHEPEVVLHYAVDATQPAPPEENSSPVEAEAVEEIESGTPDKSNGSIPERVLNAFAVAPFKWDADTRALIDSYHEARKDNRLPPVPFKLIAGGNNIGQWFFDQIDKEIAHGPTHPRVKMGGLQEDLRALLERLIPF